MNFPPTVFIVDDEPAVRDSLKLLIELEGISAVTFASAEEFLAACRPGCCGCAIIDVRMPGMDGLQLQEEMARRELPIPIIFLTGHGDIPMSVRAIKAGAVDFLAKPIISAKLLPSIQSAFRECERLMQKNESSEHAVSCLQHLTEREREVMVLAVAGYPNKEIARRLGISHRTVEIHKSRVMHKTGAASLLDLARIAQECGLSGEAPFSNNNA